MDEIADNATCLQITVFENEDYNKAREIAENLKKCILGKERRCYYLSESGMICQTYPLHLN